MPGSAKKLSLLYPQGGEISLVEYIHTDYEGYKRPKKYKYTYQLLSQILVSWHSKWHNLVALSIVEVGYVVVGACYAKLLLIM